MTQLHALALSSFMVFAYPIRTQPALHPLFSQHERKQTPMEVLKATRPWWIVPIVVLFVLALVLVLTDVAPLRQFAYTVF